MIDFSRILLENSERAGEIHEQFLQLRHTSLEQFGLLISQQISSVQLLDSPQITITKPKPVALFNEYQLREFATGSLTNCFGPEFAVYSGRRFPRIPNAELALISRVTKIAGEKRTINVTASIESEYDVPPNAWFLEENNTPEIPYSIFMEIALQPCGFLSAYLGTPMLIPDQEFFFRNLDGQGELQVRLDSRGKTIHTRAKLTSSLVSGETIIQRFEYDLSQEGQILFIGTATFGYFSQDAMLKQAGLDGGKRTQPSGKLQMRNDSSAVEVDLTLPENQTILCSANPAQPGYRLPAGRLNLIDEVVMSQNGGSNHKGTIFASKRVDAQDWFYRCHFFQDPVMPGSLGVEAILQAIQAYVIQFGPGREFKAARFRIPVGKNLTWRYRGQILPTNQLMQVEVHLTHVANENGRLLVEGDASLWADDLRIYEIKGAAIELSEES